MPDETRVFDVTRPSHVNPSATSKPVIVGHHPVTSDPMMRADSDHSEADSQAAPELTHISFTDASSASSSEPAAAIEQSAAESVEPTMPVPQTEFPAANDSPAVFSAPEAPENPETYEPSAEQLPTPSEAIEPAAGIQPEVPQPQPSAEQPHIEGLHFEEPKRKGRWLKLIIILILVLLIGAYLAIDSGAIGSGIKLPFHVFKQKPAPKPAATSTNNQSAVNTSTLPSGFKEYKLAGTAITFAAPTVWGDPASTTEAGYLKRGGNNQSSGTYAYIVDFATNKDVEIAVTSAKLLPPPRTTLYYDFLQWCTGTNDGLFYQSILRFTTANKIDTPATITCDQGPLSNTQELDSKTIVQTKVPDAAGKVIGDIYVKNLSDPTLVVFRIKDAAMTNGDNIKQLLNTIQITSASSSSSSSQ